MKYGFQYKDMKAGGYIWKYEEIEKTRQSSKRDP